MLETARLTALAGTFFAMSYIGVAWVMAGTPTISLPLDMPMRVALLPSVQPIPPLSSAPVAQHAHGDGNPQRDKLREHALQASTSYILTPCDEAAKAVMVQAVSSYAQAWADMMGCGPEGCDYKKINMTAATFSTPLDNELREAIGIAFDKRGISIDDFPSSLRINVAMLVRGRGAPATACPQSRVQIIR
jgi:hypothetical protein